MPPPHIGTDTRYSRSLVDIGFIAVGRSNKRYILCFRGCAYRFWCGWGEWGQLKEGRGNIWHLYSVIPWFWCFLDRWIDIFSYFLFLGFSLCFCLPCLLSSFFLVCSLVLLQYGTGWSMIMWRLGWEVRRVVWNNTVGREDIRNTQQ